MADFNQAKLVKDGHNASLVVCKICKTKILRAAKGEYVNEELALVQGKTATETVPESYWWHIKDMFDFENIGFSHSVQGKKYLTCANCEQGVLGVSLIGGRILLCHSRVNYA